MLPVSGLAQWELNHYRGQDPPLSPGRMGMSSDYRTIDMMHVPIQVSLYIGLLVQCPEQLLP
jgi:hypothetical protein